MYMENAAQYITRVQNLAFAHESTPKKNNSML